MANHDSSKKSIRKIKARTAINKSRKTMIKTYIKKVVLAISSGEHQEAMKALIRAQSEIMRGVSRGVIEKNAASRKVSRLNKMVKSI